MFSGFYTAASGVLTQQRVLNVLSNNLVNANTPGYRAERVVSGTFDFELFTRMEAGNTAPLGTVVSPIRLVQEVPVAFDPASLEETGRTLDFALGGAGFFNIRQPAPEGEEEGPVLLTRGGSFAVDEEGYLVLPGRGRVLGQRGEIRVEGAGFTVESDGTVYNSRGRRVDILLVTQPPQTARLEKVDNGLYALQDAQDNQPLQEARVYQGVLERANVDINRELSLLLEAQRAFQSCSQALKIMDGMNQKAASEIASL